MRDVLAGNANLTSPAFPGASSQIDLNGTLTPAGVLTGSTAYTDYENGEATSGGSTELQQGSLATNNCRRLTIKYVGQDSWGDHCRVTGTITVNK
jgi:hypothetical protein